MWRDTKGVMLAALLPLLHWDVRRVLGVPQVADIKRVNGLLSDQAMFAKDKLLIPTHAVGPLG